MRWARGIVLGLGGFLGLGLGSAGAYEPIGRCGGEPCTWASPQVPYYFHEADSDDLGDQSEQEIVNGMGAWGQVACTGLEPQYLGRTSVRPGSVDGLNVVGFIESGWRRGSGTIGTTSSRLSGEISHSDIVLNGQHFRWVTGPGDARQGTVNAFSIIAHEGGHFYGLGHSREDGALMEPSYRSGILEISDDDQAGICALYPGMPPSSECDGTTPCPGSFECVAGRCRGPEAILCTACANDEECGGSSDRCFTYPDGSSACGFFCEIDDQCPLGYLCTSDGVGARQCVRYSGGIATCQDAPPPGQMDGGQAPAPEVGAGSPRDAGAGGPGSTGAPCDIDRDCLSSLCVGDGPIGTCSQRCRLEIGCPGTLVCRAGLCLPRADASRVPERKLTASSCRGIALPDGGWGLLLVLVGFLGRRLRSARERRPSSHET